MTLAKEILLNARVRAITRKSVFDGLTTTEQRRERFRKLIVKYQLQGKFGEQFRAVYGVSLAVLWAIFRISFDAVSGAPVGESMRVNIQTFDTPEACLSALIGRPAIKTAGGVAAIEVCKQTEDIST